MDGRVGASFGGGDGAIHGAGLEGFPVAENRVEGAPLPPPWPWVVATMFFALSVAAVTVRRVCGVRAGYESGVGRGNCANAVCS